jgi:diaminopimelate epimerase
VKFSKLQAAANDFILVDALTQTLSLEGRGLGEGDWRELARAVFICVIATLR